MPVKKKSKPDNTLRFKVDGVPYQVPLDNIPNRVGLELYQQARVTWPQVQAVLNDGMDVWALAALMFVADRCAGGTLRYDTILDSITDETEIEVDGGDDPPEV